MTSTDARSEFSAVNCSVARALEIVGEKWTLLVLREAFYGVRRFDGFLANLGIARNLLSARIKTLVEHGILERRPYREPGLRERVEYTLSERGGALFPILLGLMQWGDRYLADSAGPPVLVRHRGCGAEVRVELVCESGHRALDARATIPEATGAAIPRRSPARRASPS